MRAPTPFGRQLLLERIAVGGMAEVFRAKAFGVEGFERIVAVKRILASMAESPEFVRMFVDEGRIASHLSHQNIVQIYELGKHDGLYYISMEYVAGKDLRTILDRQKKLGRLLGAAPSIAIITRVAEALDYAHRKKDPAGKDLKIIHRDVSPQNVLVSYEGEVKLCDFGIAKAVIQATATQVGVLKGKFAYMSPEQVRGRPIDRRSDLFALGVVFYELLTGERLFLGESEYATLEAVRSARVSPPSSIDPSIDPRLDAIVLRLLARDPDQRYGHASELVEELYELAHQARLVFHAHQLRQLMREAYGAELREENARLEGYAALGPELLQAPLEAEDTRAPRRILEALGVGDEPRDPASGPRSAPEPSLPSLDVAPVGVAQHDDLSTTVMGDDVSSPGTDLATIASEGVRETLQAEIEEAQAAMMERLSAIGRGDPSEIASVPPARLIAGPGAFDVSTVLDDPAVEPVPDVDEPPTAVSAPQRRAPTGASPRLSSRSPPAVPRGTPPPLTPLTPLAAPAPSAPAARPERLEPIHVREVAALEGLSQASSGAGVLGPPRPDPLALRSRPIVERIVERVAADVEDKTPPPVSLLPFSSSASVAAMAQNPMMSAATRPPLPPQERRARGQLAAALAALTALVLALLLALALLQGQGGASLRVDTRPVRLVELRLDDRVVATETPVELGSLPLGEHTIEVRATGFQTYRQTFALQEERPHTLNIPLVSSTSTTTHGSEAP